MRKVICFAVAVTVLTGCTEPQVTAPSETPTKALGVAHVSREDLRRDLQRVLSQLPRVDAPAIPDYEQFRIGKEVPGYGGGYFDSGDYVIRLRDRGQAEAARQAVARRIGSSLRQVSPRGELPRFRYREADYDIQQLTAWRITASFARNVIPEIVMIATSMADNRLEIGLSDPAAADRIREELADWGIPREAIQFIGIAKVEFTADETLTAFTERPRGGIGIITEQGTSGSSSGCSIGLVMEGKVGTPQYGNYRFMTASHCTRTMSANNSTYFHQPASPNLIGMEIADPPVYPYNPNYVALHPCFSSWGCLESDVAIVEERGAARQWNRGFSYIAKPPVKASTRLDSPNSNFYVVGTTNAQSEGAPVQKVGAATGWTSGSIYRSCMEIPVPNDGSGRRAVMPCQVLATYVNSKGDSGGPVFSFEFESFQDNVIFRGIQSGNVLLSDGRSYAFYSGYRSIMSDFWTGGSDYGALNNYRLHYNEF